MSFNTSEKPNAAIKQIIIVLLTIVSLFPPISSLIASVNQPQVQSNLQLYQVNLSLQAAADPLQEERSDSIQILRATVLGEKPLDVALEQYRNTLEAARKNDNGGKDFVKDLEIKIGILEAARGNVEAARTVWDNILKTEPNKTARVLTDLWSEPPRLAPDSEIIIRDNPRGWFRYTALERLYTIDNRSEELKNLREKQAVIAIESLYKLILIALLPIAASFIGIAIILILLTQFFLRRERAILAIDSKFAWEANWGLEPLWWVFIIGFFFAGQIVLPAVFGLIWNVLGLNPGQLSLKTKAIYVVISYLTMTSVGLTVLYLALKPYRPLPKDWFKFKLWSKWPLWGLGGYLVALPSVIIVSLINQQIWHGQGGSNPLLTLALESRDTFALLCFAFTASVAAPFFEEILFRGFLLPSLTRYMPVWGAIGLSGLIFALAHQNLSEVLPLATLGIILGVVYTRSRNLLASMLVHSLWNGGTLVSLYLLGSSSG